ncbi:DUF2256 domain-containing protein [Methylocystis parvus]|uniref:DUF2256 domain-containing protein n=1 Tax=Methylocystis parvus TaxID=134 RepID=UPI003C73743F
MSRHGQARGKANLPEKICLACGRPFAWRKKWRACWEEVKTCSERCRGDLRRERRAQKNESA